MSKSPIEQAYVLARTGRFKNFTAVKEFMRRQFNVERVLVGRTLSTSITALCRTAQAEHEDTDRRRPAAQAHTPC